MATKKKKAGTASEPSRKTTKRRRKKVTAVAADDHKETSTTAVAEPRIVPKAEVEPDQATPPTTDDGPNAEHDRPRKAVSRKKTTRGRRKKASARTSGADVAAGGGEVASNDTAPSTDSAQTGGSARRNQDPPRPDGFAEGLTPQDDAVSKPQSVPEATAPENTPSQGDAPSDGPGRPTRRGRRGRRRRSEARTEPQAATEPQGGESASQEPEATGEAPPHPRKKKTRRRRSGADKPSPEESPAAATEEPPKSSPGSSKRSTTRKTAASGRDMLINVSRGEECRIAVLQNGKLDELYYERDSAESHVGNIYKAVVTNVEASIQAAFLDFGLGKNGFLHISDLQPQYFPGDRHETENVGRKISRRHRPPIQKCLHKGDEVIVQVIKEGIGTKGPTLSTYLSIPGRYLVMMPGMSKIGVSRKIEDMEDRQDMRDVLHALKLPPDMGFILRTAGLGRTKRELQNDLSYLSRLWKTVVKRIKREQGPALLYKESDLVIRTIRDIVTPDFDRIITDDEETARNAKEFLSIAMPRSASMVEFDPGHQPLFHKFSIEAQIEGLYSKHVPLKSGGSLVIESTEALVAIDVNSGRYRAQDNAEATAFKINMEAAEEIAHQLRLRDLGGLIVCDFIDMAQDKNNRQVEKTLRDALKAHKERVQILRMSNFGIIEMTRQRQRPSIKRALFADCPHCSGSGLIKSLETQVLDVMRAVQVSIHTTDVARLNVRVPPEVGYTLLNRKRAVLTQLESELDKEIHIDVDPNCRGDEVVLEAVDRHGRSVRLGQQQGRRHNQSSK
jgi:ribonuclease E